MTFLQISMVVGNYFVFNFLAACLEQAVFCIRRVCVRADKIIMFLSFGELFGGASFFLLILFIRR